MTLMKPSDRICAALDFGSWREAEPFARTIAPAVGMLKVGLEIFVSQFIEPFLYGSSTGISALAG